MVAEGVKYAVMEVSSHALALKRVACCNFDIAVFTNLTQDHLDFHHTMEDYCRVKTELFAMLDKSIKKETFCCRLGIQACDGTVWDKERGTELWRM